MWITESAWQPVMVCLLGFCVFTYLYSHNRKVLMLGLMMGCLLAATGIFIIERVIVTDAERLEQSVYHLAEACVSGDIEKTSNFASSQKPEIAGVIRAGMTLVDVKEDLGVSDLQVTMNPDGQTAKTHFRANGTFAMNPVAQNMGQDFEQHVASRWLLTWTKTGDEWKIIDLTRLHPLSGEEMGVLERRAN